MYKQLDDAFSQNQVKIYSRIIKKKFEGCRDAPVFACLQTCFEKQTLTLYKRQI